ncbi:hypothetical protein FOZ61_007381 [Perkinsus olseni]|uniref:Uncharacterized protein n=1 Tax=Perkinsus olseni TaxID=32597 RepID=A0A7J6L982_PEROL|nr:hypothetical protein FOZ61_007381 [Perkinsus olseni]
MFGHQVQDFGEIRYNMRAKARLRLDGWFTTLDEAEDFVGRLSEGITEGGDLSWSPQHVGPFEGVSKMSAWGGGGIVSSAMVLMDACTKSIRAFASNDVINAVVQ